LILWGAAQAATTAEAGAAGLRVGSVAELDTAELRRVIEGARPAAAPAPEARVFHLTLDEALRIALENNLSLQIATLDRDAVEREVPATRAKFHPVAGFDALANEERLVDAPEDPTEEGLEDFQAGTAKDQEQAGAPFVRQELPTGGTLTVSTDVFRESERDPDERGEDDYEGGTTLLLRQPLLRGGGVWVAHREIYDAEYNRDVFEAALQALALNVAAQTKEAYWNALLAQRLIEVSEQAIARDRELIEASHALFRGGRANQRDVVSAGIRLADDEALLAQRRGDLDRAQLVLRDVLGLPIDEPVWPAERTVPFEPVEIRLGEWVERALASRPEIRGLVVRLEQQALAVRIAGNTVLPALDFLGAYRRADFDSTSRTVWGGYDSQVWEAGLHFEIPIGNVAARERLRAAKLLYERAERDLRNQRRQIEIEVRTEAIGLGQSLESLAAQTAKLEDARSKLDIASTRYQLGLANNFDVTDAQEDLVDAESALLQAIVDYANGLARLEARIAGPL
jgi:outer membrane protein TolC